MIVHSLSDHLYKFLTSIGLTWLLWWYSLFFSSLPSASNARLFCNRTVPLTLLFLANFHVCIVVRRFWNTCCSNEIAQMRKCHAPVKRRARVIILKLNLPMVEYFGSRWTWLKVITTPLVHHVLSIRRPGAWSVHSYLVIVLEGSTYGPRYVTSLQRICRPI
jgi:hypothetical protein